MRLDAGYSYTLFDHVKLRAAARAAVEVLVKVRCDHGDIHLAVTGKSGIAMAFAINMIAEFPVVVVRKPAEMSHGSTIEGMGILDKYVIIDDFVATGRTIKNIMAAIDGYAALRDGDKPECLGFVEYTRYGDSQRYRVERSCGINNLAIEYGE